MIRRPCAHRLRASSIWPTASCEGTSLGQTGFEHEQLGQGAVALAVIEEELDELGPHLTLRRPSARASRAR